MAVWRLGICWLEFTTVHDLFGVLELGPIVIFRDQFFLQNDPAGLWLTHCALSHPVPNPVCFAAKNAEASASTFVSKVA